MSLNPYGLPADWLALAVVPEEVEGILDPETAAAVPGIDEQLETKLHDWHSLEEGATLHQLIEGFVLHAAKVGKSIQYEITALEAARRDLDARIKARESRLASLRTWLRSCLEGHGLKGAKDERLTVWLALNSQPTVTVLDEAAVPDAWLRATLVMPRDQVPEGFEDDIRSIEVDKARIAANAKETGEVPPGVEIERGSHVSWR